MANARTGGFARLQAVTLPTGVAQPLNKAFRARAQWGLCSVQAGKVTAVHVVRLVPSARSLSDFGTSCLVDRATEVVLLASNLVPSIISLSFSQGLN